MRKLGNSWHLFIFGLLLLLAAFIRFKVAPLSAGPDVAQFWAFAEAFRLYGLDFYRYAGATTELFPFQLWAYVYPPVWLLILGLAYVFMPNVSATHEMVDAGWRLAAKTPIILADLSIGILLYRAVPGQKYRKLLVACVWLFNPATWYNSAVFGQFDSIALAFLLAAVILLEKGRDRLAFVLAALAGMTKQHTFLSIAIMVVICARIMNWRRLLSNLAVLGVTVIAISIPFLVTGNYLDYLKAVLFPGQSPDYQLPQMFAFNAGSAIMTWLHTAYQWDTIGWIKLGTPLLALALAATAVLCYLKKVDLLRGALIGMLVFVLFFYRINYQYLVIIIALALLIAAKTTHESERALALGLAIYPAGWLWLVNVATWFVYLNPTDTSLIPLLDRLGLTHQGFADYIYVCFTVIFNLLCLAYLALAFTRWKEPLIHGNFSSSVVAEKN